jgi:hypothetical protein
MARLASTLAEPEPQRCFRYPSPPVAMPSCADSLDADGAWLLGAARRWPALRPPKGSEQRRLDTALAEVCEAIGSSELRDGNIVLSIVCRPIVLGGWRSWQMCMIIAELLLDAVRNSRDVRSIAVELAVADEIRCVVVDDGVASPSAGRSRASIEVDALVAELGGRVVRSSDETGSAVMVCVPGAALQLERPTW